MASLAEISRRAEVSIATASRVLNGSTHPVSAQTRERVLAAASELGYSPSALGRALVTRTSRIIGVIVGDIVDPYFAEIARGVDDVAARMGHLTMVCNADRRTAAEIAHLKVLRDYHAAGVVFAGSGFAGDPRAGELDRAVADLREHGTTVVALAKRDFACHRVLFDNRAAAYDITDYVISLGHRRIAFIRGPEGLHTSRLRLDGFRAAMEDAGLDPSVTVEGGFEYEAGYNAVMRLLAVGPLPEAIVAVNDEAAVGALMSLRQAGVDVPGTISVTGIDDTRPARFLELTTISVPRYEMGAVATRKILGDEAGDDGGSEVVLPHRLTARRTTARRER
jgi:LacI family transcriptional regulator